MKQKLFITLSLSTISLLFNQTTQAQCHTRDSFIVHNIDTIANRVTARIKFYYSRVSSGQTSAQIHYAPRAEGPWTLINCYNLTGTNGSSDSVITADFTYDINQALYSKVTLWKNGQCGGSQCSSAQVIPPATPLPVTLFNFNVSNQQRAVALTWSTAKEQDNKGFEVERSTDGSNWENIIFVNSLSKNGNSSSKLDYITTDLHPAANRNIYRLKQIDYNGNYAYSPVRSVLFDTKDNTINVHPNPAKDKVTISGLKANEMIKLYDMTGRLVYQSQANATAINIPLTNITAGLYYLNINAADGTTSSHKIVKIN